MGRGTVVPERIGDTPVSWILREKITSEKNDTDKDGRTGWTGKPTAIHNSSSKRADILF